MQTIQISFKSLVAIYFEIFEELIPQVDIILRIILRKILSNIESANLLIEQGVAREAKILLRSSTESVVLFCYLVQFPDKKDEYIKDSQLLGFKNNFMVYKNFKNYQDNPIFKEEVAKFSLEKLKEEHENIFEDLHPDNKEKILKEINCENYELNDKTLDKLDKFFRYKPFFMDLEKMYRELVEFKNLSMQLRELLFTFYNEDSQIAHGRFQDWTDKKLNEIDISTADMLISRFARIFVLPIIACQEIEINVSQEKMIKLQQEINNLRGSIGE
ncbi:MAG: hypothetical protein A2Y25_02400 [Candidatus Melainabacteria bacterium GWF2_37_15]|nr:MAG: hypothetical protein A2Y25_02400 [Candidatus Melainabacteria bacterium GWF2_37_15]